MIEVRPAEVRRNDRALDMKCFIYNTLSIQGGHIPVGFEIETTKTNTAPPMEQIARTGGAGM